MKHEKIKLAAEHKRIFHLVEEVAFGNPFAPEREKMTLEFPKTKEKATTKLEDLSVAIVQDIVQILDGKGKADFRLYRNEDKTLIRTALLYDTFYRFISDFDKLIQAQIDADAAPVNVSFAENVLAIMKSRGFTHEDAIRYLAFFYQLRRAFYFIDKTLVGQSLSMRKLRSHLWANIFTRDPRWYENFLWDRMEDFSTFLIGETGTGKGTAAAALGRSGFIPYLEKKRQFAESFTQNFIEINLSQFPETIIESELFGHKKGSFTGAVEDHSGVFARCKKYGAILLDEIGDISIAVQIKLLKVLQERSFTVVGGHKKERFQGRVIAATNRSLDNLRQEGRFRDDFYYRLCSDVIRVPSLREQIKEDPSTLEIILDFTIARIVGEPAPELALELQQIIIKEVGLNYEWPGNVRELEQAVRRILLTKHYQRDFCKTSTEKGQALFIQDMKDGNLTAHEVLSSYCYMLYLKYGTYEKVSQITKLDRRTAKKYIKAVQND